MKDERNITRPVGGVWPGVTSSTMFAALKRSLIRAGLYARGTIEEAARSVADACAARPEAGRLSNNGAKHTSYDPMQVSQSFADLPIYRS